VRLSRAPASAARIPVLPCAAHLALLLAFAARAGAGHGPGAPVDLPRAEHRLRVPRGAVRLALAGDAEGEAARSLARDPGTTFVIRADRRVPYERVDELLDALQRAGARRVLLECRR
jgi:hypothetical protein